MKKACQSQRKKTGVRKRPWAEPVRRVEEEEHESDPEDPTICHVRSHANSNTPPIDINR